VPYNICILLLSFAVAGGLCLGRTRQKSFPQRTRLARVRREYAFGLVGYVVMPEHVHLLVSEPKRGTPSTMLQMLKQRVSRKMRQKKRGFDPV
jgi:REP element-mobilizing transposase RayT